MKKLIYVLSLSLLSCNSVMDNEGATIKEITTSGCCRCNYRLRTSLWRPDIILLDSCGKYNVGDQVFISKK